MNPRAKKHQDNISDYRRIKQLEAENEKLKKEIEGFGILAKAQKGGE